MAPRETENNTYAKFGVTNKEYYGMLWYFLEWSITCTVPLRASCNKGNLSSFACIFAACTVSV